MYGHPPPGRLWGAIAHPDQAPAKRAFDAMMRMTQMETDGIEPAVRG
jgi:hypothetical protein